MKYKSRLTGRNRTMLTTANTTLQRSRSRRRTREASRKVFLLGMLGGVSVGAVLLFSGSPTVPADASSKLSTPAMTVVAASAKLPEAATPSPSKVVREDAKPTAPAMPVAEVVGPQPEVDFLDRSEAPVKEAATKADVVEKSKTAVVVDTSPKPEPVQPAGERVKQLISERTPSKPVSYPGVDQVLSKKMFTLFEDYDVPEAGVAVVDIQSGEVLTALGYKDGDLANGLAKEARWPAASVFKIVTASALMGKGVHSGTEICFNGGFRPITASDLRGTGGNTCASMKTSFSRSYNVPFARWSNNFLTRDELTREAHAFGFQRTSALGLPKASHGKLEIPLDKVKRGGAAAGFGEIYLSPLHGALMAAAIGNGGAVRKPVWQAGKTTEQVRVFPSSRAKALQNMMVATVRSGTARRTFKEQGKPALGKHGAGGKTGTLGHRGRDLSWFVGFAPAENPRYAVGAYVANRPTWRIRATYVGREALRSALLKTSPYRPRKSSLASR